MQIFMRLSMKSLLLWLSLRTPSSSIFMPEGLPRHFAGREEFAHCISAWLQRSTLNAASFCRAASMALGSSRLHPAQLSGMRVGLAKQISIYTFDALGAVNFASYRYHRQNVDTETSLRELLNLIPPVTSIDGEPLKCSGFSDLFLGLKTDWQLPEHWLGVDWSKGRTEPEPVSIADLGRCVRTVLQSLPGDILDNLDQLAKYYPSKDQLRIQRLKTVVMGLDQFSVSEAETESLAICVALTAMTEVKFDLQTLLDIENAPEKLGSLIQL